MREQFPRDEFCIVISKDVFVAKPGYVSDSDKMRDRASQLLDSATRSECEGRSDYARVLTNVAAEILKHARELEQRDAKASLRRHQV